MLPLVFTIIRTYVAGKRNSLVRKNSSKIEKTKMVGNRPFATVDHVNKNWQTCSCSYLNYRNAKSLF